MGWIPDLYAGTARVDMIMQGVRTRRARKNIQLAARIIAKPLAQPKNSAFS